MNEGITFFCVTQHGMQSEIVKLGNFYQFSSPFILHILMQNIAFSFIHFESFSPANLWHFLVKKVR